MGSNRLRTIHEVPTPKKMCTSYTKLSCHRKTNIQFMISLAGAPLVPFDYCPCVTGNTKDLQLERAMAAYIMHQYIAQIGGNAAINGIDSMYAMGDVEMVASDSGFGKSYESSDAEIGSFVLWQKMPDLWCLEMVLSGCRIVSGSDGKISWRQADWDGSHYFQGSPRPLRRSLQGLDPRSMAKLFLNSVYKGDKVIKGIECFQLVLEADPLTLEASSNEHSAKIMSRVIKGYFSHKTCLLIMLEDIQINSDGGIYLETKTKSLILDYQTVDGIKIAHRGKTHVSVLMYDEEIQRISETKIKEHWKIKEVEFNIKGLGKDCFLPPESVTLKKVAERVSF